MALQCKFKGVQWSDTETMACCLLQIGRDAAKAVKCGGNEEEISPSSTLAFPSWYSDVSGMNAYGVSESPRSGHNSVWRNASACMPIEMLNADRNCSWLYAPYDLMGLSCNMFNSPLMNWTKSLTVFDWTCYEISPSMWHAHCNQCMMWIVFTTFMSCRLVWRPMSMR